MFYLPYEGGEGKGQVGVWDIERGTQVWLQESQINAVSFVPGRNDRLITGYSPTYGKLIRARLGDTGDGTPFYGLTFWDLASRRIVSGYIHSRLKVPDPEPIICSHDGSQIIFAPVGIVTGRKVRPVPWEMTVPVRGFVGPDRILVGNTVHRFSNGEVLQSLGDCKEGSYTAALSPDGSILVTFSKKNVLVWDTASGVKTRELEHEQYVSCIAISPDGSLVAAAGSYKEHCTGTVIVWDRESGRVLVRVAEAAMAYADLAFTKDGRSLVSAVYGRKEHSGRCMVRVWDISEQLK